MMMSSSKKVAASTSGVVGGKTARACDSCVKRRARWYCPADDAFLCQPCDASVHSANSLARRHHRVRLKTSSSSSSSPSAGEALPAWHQGFTRKARTPRNSSNNNNNNNNNLKHVSATLTPHKVGPGPALVPEIINDATTMTMSTSPEDVNINDEDLLYRVPIFDPLVAEFCRASAAAPPTTTTTFTYNTLSSSSAVDQNKAAVAVSPEMNPHAFLPTEMDLAEFAADVESLLGSGLENECNFGMEGLGFVDCKEKEYFHAGGGRVKIELDEEEEEEEEEEDDDIDVNMKICWTGMSTEIDMTRPEPFELNYEEYSPASCGEEVDDETKAAVFLGTEDGPAKTEPGVVEEEEDSIQKSKSSGKKMKKKKKILLRLDYDGVITAWASQGSPWTTGDRPDLDPDAAWPDCMGTYGVNQIQHHHYMDMSSGFGGGTPAAILADGGREARVSRYREKRRTRLFSKKIRYEVRKLNAEKRPRMKGRFVKRASFVGPHFPLLK